MPFIKQVKKSKLCSVSQCKLLKKEESLLVKNVWKLTATNTKANKPPMTIFPAC